MTIGVIEKIICKCALKAKPLGDYIVHIMLLLGMIVLSTSAWNLYDPISTDAVHRIISIFVTILGASVVFGCIINLKYPLVFSSILSLSDNTYICYAIISILIACIISVILYEFYSLGAIPAVISICMTAACVITIRYLVHVVDKCPKMNESNI